MKQVPLRLELILKIHLVVLLSSMVSSSLVNLPSVLEDLGWKQLSLHPPSELVASLQPLLYPCFGQI